MHILVKYLRFQLFYFIEGGTMRDRIKLRYNRLIAKIEKGNGFYITEDVVEDAKTGLVEPYSEWMRHHNEDDFLETIKD
jgi:hypothetical protein